MRRSFLVADLAWGDCGKGSIVDYLVRKHDASLVVRYNGGSQCAHNVVTPDGRHHTFAQFGSGMFSPNVATYLSRFMLVDPINMMIEEDHLQQVGIIDAWERTFVSENCLIITPFQRAINRLREMSRGESRHGSCGLGVGETRFDHLIYGDEVLFAHDIKHGTAKKKLETLLHIAKNKLGVFQQELPDTQQVQNELNLLNSTTIDWCLEAYERWPARGRLRSDSELPLIFNLYPNCVFEGAQGVLLDETFGDRPHNTWTDTTFNNAMTLLKEAEYEHPVTRIGVIRSYMTRHGAGPFLTEDPELGKLITEQHNTTGTYQGDFRFGHFDHYAIQRALDICGGVDEVYMNHMDQLPLASLKSELSDFYEEGDYFPYGFVKDVENTISAPITLLGWGPKATDKKERVSLLTAKNLTMSVTP